MKKLPDAQKQLTGLVKSTLFEGLGDEEAAGVGYCREGVPSPGPSHV